MPWFLASPGHEQYWYQICRMEKSLSKEITYPYYMYFIVEKIYIDGLAQDCSNSIANALELP